MSCRQIWGPEIGKSYPGELRDRAVLRVVQGSTQTEAAQRLCVSIKLVNDMVRIKRETGSLAPPLAETPASVCCRFP